MNDIVIPEVRWLLDCDPRPAQIEATLRSYHGIATRDHVDAEQQPRILSHGLMPAIGFNHFMQMRLGKTPTALNEFMLFKADHGLNKALIVSPNKYKWTWQLEAEKFGVDVPVCVLDTANRKEAQQFVRTAKEGILVVHYEAFNNEANKGIIDAWVDKKTYMPFDESVLIKNPQARTTKAAILTADRAAVVRTLTGLPAPQSVCDLWSQLRVTRHTSGTNFYAFRGRYARMGGFKNKKVVGGRNEEELDAKLNQWAFRAKRRDWTDYLESDYEITSLSMLPEQKSMYDQMNEDFIVWLNDDELVSAEQVITKRMKMQQIASGFIFDEHGVPRVLVPMEKTPKFIDLKDMLDNYIDGKVIVFAHYRHTISELYRLLKPYGVSLIAGDQDMKKMDLNAEEEKRKFNGGGNKVMIGQSASIKYGHTLMGVPGDRCETEVFFENSYSLDTRAQCEERPQGHGQQNSIAIVDYASCSVEKEIIRALQQKKNVAEAIMTAYGYTSNGTN